jgi:cytoskeletal protein CcmA (bactofilin family)
MKIRSIIIALVIAVFGFVLFAPKAHAQQFRNEENIVVGKNDTVDSSLAANGSTINIEGNIDGDLYCLGSQVVISGRVNGDVFCIAQSINISGRVDGSIRLVTGDVNLSGSVKNDGLVMAQNFILTDKGTIGRDLTLSTGGARMNGSIGRDLAVMAQTLELGGYIGRNVSGRVMKLTVNSTADVRGDIKYTGNTDAIRLSGSKVSGSIVRTPMVSTPSYGDGIGGLVVGYLVFVGSLLIVSMASIWALPKFFVATNKEIDSSLAKTSLYGLANLFLVPLVLIALTITLVGIPLAGLIAVAWILGLILCGPVAAYFIGSKVLKGKKASKNEYLVMLVGSLIILALYIVPVVNLLVGLAVGIVGSGAIMAHFKHLNTRSKKA